MTWPDRSGRGKTVFTEPSLYRERAGRATARPLSITPLFSPDSRRRDPAPARTRFGKAAPAVEGRAAELRVATHRW